MAYNGDLVQQANASRPANYQMSTMYSQPTSTDPFNRLPSWNTTSTSYRPLNPSLYGSSSYSPFGAGGAGGTGGGTSGASGSGSSGPTNAASSWYAGVLNGTNLPYSPFAKANLVGKATSMNAAAESARNDTMAGRAAAGGASANDPSLRGAQMNSMARRQTDNANSVGEIESQANQANFSAQANAAARMTQTQLAYDEMANSNAMRFSPFSGGGGTSSRSINQTPGFLQWGNTGEGPFNTSWSYGQSQQDAEQERYRQSQIDGTGWNGQR